MLARTCFEKGLRKVIPMSADNDFLTDARDSARARRLVQPFTTLAAILNFTRGGASAEVIPRPASMPRPAHQSIAVSSAAQILLMPMLPNSRFEVATPL